VDVVSGVDGMPNKRKKQMFVFIFILFFTDLGLGGKTPMTFQSVLHSQDSPVSNVAERPTQNTITQGLPPQLRKYTQNVPHTP
jgi:hypothetical protein